MEFLIHAPRFEHTHISAGARAMWKLGKELSARGHNVKMPSDNGVLSYYADDLQQIHIYPESLSGNPAPNEKVVRWMLGARLFPKREGELEVVWANSELYPDQQRLMVDVIDQTLFYPKVSRGSGTLFYQGKAGRDWDRAYSLSDLVAYRDPNWTEVTLRWPPSRLELADLLRSADLFVTADGNTALIIESMLCGTPVLPINGYLPTNTACDGFCCGIARDWADVHRAREATQLAPEHHEARCAAFAGDVDALINTCRKTWG